MNKLYFLSSCTDEEIQKVFDYNREKSDKLISDVKKERESYFLTQAIDFVDGNALQILPGYNPANIFTDEVTFIIVPNGSGKTSLVSDIIKSGTGALYISASRPALITESSTAFTDAKRQDYESAKGRLTPVKISDRSADSVDFHRALYDLKQLDHSRDAIVREMVLNGESAIDQAKKESALDTISRLFQQSGMRLTFHRDSRSQYLVRGESGKNYSITELSDGERNAFVLSARILTAGKNANIILDEPERHLNPAISRVLIRDLIKVRKDCRFIVSTHDLYVVEEFHDGRVLIIDGCRHLKSGERLYRGIIINTVSDIPLDVKNAIVGSLGSMFFVEGESESHEKVLYNALMPEEKIISKGSNTDVISTVKFSRKLNVLGRMSYGIVDRDYDDKEMAEGVFKIKYNCVEAALVCRPLIHVVVTHITSGSQDPIDRKMQAYEAALLSHLESTAETLAIHKAKHKVRRDVQNVVDGSVSKPEIDSDVIVPINYARYFSEERSIISDAISRKDAEFILREYRVKSRGVLKTVAKSIGMNGIREVIEVLEERVIACNSTRKLVRDAVFPEGLVKLLS